MKTATTVEEKFDLSSYTMGQLLQDLPVARRQRIVTPGLRALQERTTRELKQLRATGMNENLPFDGGVFVGQTLLGGLIDKTYENSRILSRVNRLTSTKNEVALFGVSESDRADGSRQGGLRAYWITEGENLPESHPTFRRIGLRLKKLSVLSYASSELAEDAALLEAETRRTVSAELDFQLVDAIINGTGHGRPLGILHSPALVTVDKDDGQTADTITYSNIVNMHSRFWGRNGVWLANRDVFPQLAQMSLTVGDGGSAVPLLSNEPGGGLSLVGMPVIFAEQCPTLGEEGDIILADLSQYVLVDKGGVQSAVSVHAQFVNDELAYRFLYRVDGQPTWSSPLEPYEGSTTRSPFVTLQARA